MHRKTFLTLMAGTTGMAALGSVRLLNELFAENGTTMPALFVGHGSPMNGIEDNLFSNSWKKLGSQLPKPNAILVVSAHWLTKGTFITAMEKPKTIHDFGGFPEELFNAQYPASGNPELAQSIAKEITSHVIGLDHEWGLDHGCWTILNHFYPNADVPVLQLSIDYNEPAQFHYELGQALRGQWKHGAQPPHG
jgi:4,5-DOPA dioxygenase extradiol